MESSGSMYNKAMPYLAMVFMRFGSAGMPIVAKFALNRGMSQHVLVVYRFAIATLVLAPFAIVFDRYCCWAYWSKELHHRAKNFIIINKAITLKSYPAELSLTTLVCFMGAIEGTIVALVMEGGNAAAWSIHWDSKLFAAAYSGVICSGVAYYVGAMVIQAKGPVFFAAFNPLTMVIVAIMSSFIFSEIMVIGVIVIVVGLYLVLWGKSKDQHSSDSDSNKAAAAPRSGEQMATIGNETAAVTSNQDFVLLDVSSSASAAADDESVKEKNQKQIP
ncbi:hypothetical protein QQP08_005077 [Theobroma cacao]|nr:hypothetical protein QQP08_005077 [Theobroma cacao]